MPLSMPMWPPLLADAPTPAPIPRRSPEALQRQWLIVDGTVRRLVAEVEFRAALVGCDRLEVVRYPHSDIETHICYRATP
jgi:hypothetical protein